MTLTRETAPDQRQRPGTTVIDVTDLGSGSASTGGGPTTPMMTSTEFEWPFPVPTPRRGQRRRERRRRRREGDRRRSARRRSSPTHPLRRAMVQRARAGHETDLRDLPRLSGLPDGSGFTDLGEADDAGRRGPVHRARRTLQPTAGWRALVATLGAILLTLCSGMALGVVTWSPSSGLALNFRSAPQQPPLVTGADGIWPGGPASAVPLTVQNPDVSAFEITGVAADLTALPADCPQAAWRIGSPGLLPTVPARSEVAVPLPVALRDDAPASCQGVTARFPVRIDGLRHVLAATAASGGSSTDGAGNSSGGDPSTTAPSGATLTPQQLSAEAVVTVARLGSPGGTVAVRGGTVAITPTRPGRGPAPARYAVDLLGAGSQRTDLCGSVTTSCVDAQAPAAAGRRYRVTAWIGTSWHQSSSVLSAWTPPPAPSLAFADRSRPATSGLVVSVQGAASAYDVDLFLDGVPFHRLKVAAGQGATRTVALPSLSSGSHRLVAVATFHSWRASSATVGLTVRSDGFAEPGPSQEPPPVSSDPGPIPTGAGPPTATVPSPSTATATATATVRPSATSRPSSARPVTAPPQPVLDGLGATEEAPGGTTSELPVQVVPTAARPVSGKAGPPAASLP